MRLQCCNKRKMIPVLFLLVVAVLMPSQVLASHSPSSNLPIDSDGMSVNQDSSCGTIAAGVVHNDSSYNVRIKGNITEGGPIVTYTLLPDQNSLDDTNMCDVDEVNGRTSWWYLWGWRSIDTWVKIYGWDITCNDWQYGGGNYIVCSAIWSGPPGEEPPTSPPLPGDPEPPDGLPVPR